MKLKDLLYKVPLTSTLGSMEKDVQGISFDSRDVDDNSVFIAIRGTRVDGHDFIQSAVKEGASVIIAEELTEVNIDEVTFITVKNSAEALGIIASNFYENPSSHLQLVGITGTNGKTTSATLLFNLFRKLGYNCGLLSTVVNKINEEELPATHTTPDAITLNRLMASMVKSGVTHCFMEVSSHSIAQYRTSGLSFTGAVFTNITHDHLDYHGTFDKYIETKKKLFDGLSSSAFALVNADDKRSRIMIQNTNASKSTFGLRTMSDYKGRILSNTLQGLEIDINGKVVWFRLIGGFNGYNLLGVYGAAVLLGEEEQEVLTILSELEGVSGRFEQVKSEGQIMGIVDYAHTPDALENVLQTLKSIRTGNEQLITVVGCGGDRDKTKRPIMASIACKYSNKVIITSDNPRFEDPEQIIKDMVVALDPIEIKKVLKISDREEAIKTACMLANESDIILVAGKGHETYQDINGVKSPFDDKEVLSRTLKLNSN